MSQTYPFLNMAFQNICSEGYTQFFSAPNLGIVDSSLLTGRGKGWSEAGCWFGGGIYQEHRHTRWSVTSSTFKQAQVSYPEATVQVKYHVCWINVWHSFRSLHGTPHKVVGPLLVHRSCRSWNLRLSLMHGTLGRRRTFILRHVTCETSTWNWWANA